MGFYYADGRHAVDQVDLRPGDRVKLYPDGRRWWTVQAVSRNFAACVRQVPFQARGVLEYTVLDWRNGVRGPCNMVGQGFGDGTYSVEQCERMLVEFERSWTDDVYPLEVSQRNWVRLEVHDRRPVAEDGDG